MAAFVTEALASIAIIVATHVVMFAIGVAFGERRYAATVEYALRGGDWKWEGGRLVRSDKHQK